MTTSDARFVILIHIDLGFLLLAPELDEVARRSNAQLGPPPSVKCLSCEGSIKKKRDNL